MFILSSKKRKKESYNNNIKPQSLTSDQNRNEGTAIHDVRVSFAQKKPP